MGELPSVAFGVIASFDRIDTVGAANASTHAGGVVVDKLDSQVVVSVDFFTGSRVNLMKKYDYPVKR